MDNLQSVLMEEGDVVLVDNYQVIVFLIKLVYKSTNTGLGSTTSASRGGDIGNKEREVLEMDRST